MRLFLAVWGWLPLFFSSLDAEQERGNITKTFSMATLNVSDPLGLDAGGGLPSHMEPMGGSGVRPIPTRDKTEYMPHDVPFPTGNTAGSVEASMKLNELMDLCTTLSSKVTELEDDLKKTKFLYGKIYGPLVTKVKKLEDKVKQLKSKKKAQIVDSSTSPDSDDANDDMGDSSKQGRNS